MQVNLGNDNTRQVGFDPAPGLAPAPLAAPALAPAPLGPAPLPDGWEEMIDPGSQKPYYVNHVTKSSTWDRPLPVFTPPSLPPPGVAAADVPAGPAWEEQLPDKSWKPLPANVSADLEKTFSSGDPACIYPFPCGAADDISLKRMELRRCLLPEADILYECCVLKGAVAAPSHDYDEADNAAIIAARKAGQKTIKLPDKPWGSFEIRYGEKAISPQYTHPIPSGAAQVNLRDNKIREVKAKSKSAGTPATYERRAIRRDPNAPPKFFYLDDKEEHKPYSDVSCAPSRFVPWPFRAMPMTTPAFC
jgi:hypothetical protein